MRFRRCPLWESRVVSFSSRLRQLMDCPNALEEVLHCTALYCFLISLRKTMHVAEAVPHFSPKVAKNDVLSQKTQVSETLATVSGPSLARVSEIWVFWVFWDSASFWISYGYKFGTASAKCMVLKKDPAQLQSSGAKPRSHVLLRAKGRHSHKIAWDSCFVSTYSCKEGVGTIKRVRGI